MFFCTGVFAENKKTIDMKQITLRNFSRFFFLLAITSIMGVSCKKSDMRDSKTLYGAISANPDYSFLTAALNKAGFVAALDKEGETQLTVFAPDNKAFMDAGFKSIADLNAVPATTLKEVLLYHVTGTKIKSADIPQATNTQVETLNGQSVFVTKTSAGKVFVNGVQVTKADINCTNGVLHKMDRVLMPATGTIVETAVAAPNLSLLVAAVLRASQGSTDVAAVLSGDGPFTVFAPTNEAFIKAGFANESAINAADPNVVANILTYHVVAGRVFSSDLTDNASVKTVQGGNVTISLSGGAKVKGNANSTASNIIATDKVTTNGVVHVIDQVLLP